MYENIGTKLKTLAQVLCIAGIISSIVLGILQMVTGNILAGILFLVIGPILSWISTWALYGIGEACENSAKILEQMNKTNNAYPNDPLFQNSYYYSNAGYDTGAQAPKTEVKREQKPEIDPESITLNDIRDGRLLFVPSRVFKNVISTASGLKDPEDIRSCLESAREILKNPCENKVISLIIYLSDAEICDIVTTLRNALQK